MDFSWAPEHQNANNIPADSPFAGIKRSSTWRIPNQSPAALQEQRNAYNTAARYAATLGQTPAPDWRSAQPPPGTPFQHAQSTFSTPAESRMDVDSPQGFVNQASYAEEDQDVIMDTPDQSHSAQANFRHPFPGRTPFKDANYDRNASSGRSPVIRLDGSDTEIVSSPKKNKGWIRKFMPGFDRKKGSSVPRRGSSVHSEPVVTVSSKLAARSSHIRRRRESISDQSEYDTDPSEPEMIVSKTRKPGRVVSRTKSPTEQDFKDPPSSIIASFFSFIDRHPNLPHILGWYIQLAFNFCAVFFIVYFLYSTWAAFVDDINKSANEDMADMLAEIAVCAKNYRDNLCDPATRVPAMEAVCNGWERCMTRNPNSVSRARVSARALAEIFNSFIETISWKAFILLIVTFMSITLGPSGILPKMFTRFIPTTAEARPVPQSGYTHPHHSLPPPATPRHLHPDPSSTAAMGYSATPFSIHYVPHTQTTSKRLLTSPSKTITIESEDEEIEGGHDEDERGSEVDGTPAPLRAIEYNKPFSTAVRRRRQASNEAIGGEDPFVPSRRISVKKV